MHKELPLKEMEVSSQKSSRKTKACEYPLQLVVYKIFSTLYKSSRSIEL